MKKKEKSGCLGPVIAFLVIFGGSILIYIGSLDDKIITYGLLAAIVVSLIVFIYNVVTIRSENKLRDQNEAKESFKAARQSAQTQIDRIKESYKSGTKQELANDFDTTVLYATMQKNRRCAVEYLWKIEEASFCYYGNRYPNRRGDLLEDVIRDEIDKHYKHG